MALYRHIEGRLHKLSAVPLDRERRLQRLLEANLFEVLELHFLASEYTTTFGGRIDTLAVDASGAPVIIEYKRNRNDNVITQALSYLRWLKTQKPGFFEKLMSDKLGAALAAPLRLEWANPRVICIAESYSKFDIDTVEVVPLRIELMKFRFYEGDLFVLEPVNFQDTESPMAAAAVHEPRLPRADAEGLARIADTGVASLGQEAPHTIEALLAKANTGTRELFYELRERIMGLDEEIVEKPKAIYVAYWLSNNFAEIYVNRNSLKVLLRPIDYNDPDGRVQQIPESYHWTLDRRVDVRSEDDIDAAMRLIEQSYQNVL